MYSTQCLGIPYEYRISINDRKRETEERILGKNIFWSFICEGLTSGDVNKNIKKGLK